MAKITFGNKTTPVLFEGVVYHAVQSVILATAFATIPDTSNHVATFRIVREQIDPMLLALIYLAGGGIALWGAWRKNIDTITAGSIVQAFALTLTVLVIISGTLRGLDGEYAFSALFLGLFGPAIWARIILIGGLRRLA